MGEKEYHNAYGIGRDSITPTLIFSHSSLLAGAARGLLELVKELTGDYDPLPSTTQSSVREGPLCFRK
jgi:hypothetical protein